MSYGLHISTREYHDKVGGNSYHTTHFTLTENGERVKVGILPPDYGNDAELQCLKQCKEICGPYPKTDVVRYAVSRMSDLEARFIRWHELEGLTEKIVGTYGSRNRVKIIGFDGKDITRQYAKVNGYNLTKGSTILI